MLVTRLASFCTAGGCDEREQAHNQALKEPVPLLSLLDAVLLMSDVGAALYRQRHPNGTVELLAQLQRRFKLPQTWLDLLPAPPQHKQPQQQHEQPQQPQPQQQQDPLLQQAAAEEMSLSAFVSQAWHNSWQLAAKASAAVHSRLALHLQNSNASTATDSTASTTGSGQQDDIPSSSSSSSMGERAHGLIPGQWQDTDSTDVQSDDTSTDSKPSSTPGNTVIGIKEYSDMQHYVYLTQLQQMLCYETALHTWRRLRSDPSTLSMGVLYWQLNDVWAGQLEACVTTCWQDMQCLPSSACTAELHEGVSVSWPLSQLATLPMCRTPNLVVCTFQHLLPCRCQLEQC